MRQRLANIAQMLHPMALPGDVIIDDATTGLEGSYIGQAWCPTPTAVDRLRAVGALLPAIPPLAVLRRVNHRAFCAELGQTLPMAQYVTSLAELLQCAARSPAQSWLLKRPFGFSGRNRLRCTLPTDAAYQLEWIAASFRRGEGLQVEPWVDRQLDCVVHGYRDATGTTRLGKLAIQDCDVRGAWQRTRLATPADLTQQESQALYDMAQHSANALGSAGYFGPFGIDSYRWRDTQGRVQWHLRGEINARYTMGWHIGMQGWRAPLVPATS